MKVVHRLGRGSVLELPLVFAVVFTGRNRSLFVEQATSCSVGALGASPDQIYVVAVTQFQQEFDQLAAKARPPLIRGYLYVVEIDQHASGFQVGESVGRQQSLNLACVCADQQITSIIIQGLLCFSFTDQLIVAIFTGNDSLNGTAPLRSIAGFKSFCLGHRGLERWKAEEITGYSGFGPARKEKSLPSL